MDDQSMKGKSTKDSRLKLASFLNGHLRAFGNSFEKIVICPTCLTELNINNDQRSFSAGHILPEAVGGKEWTFLCRGCNSKFGEKQDKWFGEHLNILSNPNGSIWHAKTKSKYIDINGQIVRGDIRISDEDQGLEIFLPINHNPVGKVEDMVFGPQTHLSVKIPLLEHENEVVIGYITAAYLYWFREIGYNWIFQSSLDVVRKQIVECDSHLDGAKVFDLNTDKFEIQGVGVINGHGVYYPCCVVVDKLVVFPAPPSVKAPTPKNSKFNRHNIIEFLNLEIFDSPYAVVYDGHHVVIPDRIRKSTPIPEFLLYIPKGLDKKPRWLTLQDSKIKN